MEWLCIPGRRTLHAFEFPVDLDFDRIYPTPTEVYNLRHRRIGFGTVLAKKRLIAVCHQTSWYTRNQLFVADYKQCLLCLKELNRRKQINQLSEYFRRPRR